jgi:hypothetical protein
MCRSIATFLHRGQDFANGARQQRWVAAKQGLAQESYCNAEIDQLDLADLEIEHDVGRVEILVNDVLPMNLPLACGNTTAAAVRSTSMHSMSRNASTNSQKVVVRSMRRV